MLRSLAVVAGLLTTMPAFAADGGGVCILQVTETFTRPSKPNLFTTKMDCGTDPSRDQAQALIAVSSKPNAADAVGHMLASGFHIVGQSSLSAKSGGARYHFFTFAERPAAARAARPDPMDDMGLSDGPDDLLDIPPAMPAEDESDLDDLSDF